MAMQKLRTTYKKYQDEVFAQKPRYIAPQNVSKYSKLAEKQIETMQNNNSFGNYEEAVFYKQKFQKLTEIADKFQKKKVPEDTYHRQIRQVLQKDFKGNLSSVRTKVGNTNNLQIGNNNYDREERPISRSGNSKSPLKEFFDEQQLKNTKKVTFSSLLPSSQVPIKMGLSARRSKSPGKSNDDGQMRRLQQLNRRYRKQLQQAKYNNNGNEQQKLKDLRNQVRKLDEQNRELRSKTSKSETFIDQQYDPYNLRIRPNNILTINSKNLNQSQRMSQIGGTSEDYINRPKGSQVYYDRDADYIRQQQMINPKGSTFIKRSDNYIEEQHNTSHSTIQTQFLNLQNSELHDEQKNSVCRQKIAFFKKSMVLYKGNDYDIAFKRSQFDYQIDRLRLILYINNKTNRPHNISIDYDYDKQYYDLKVTRKLSSVGGSNQGRQEIEIILKNSRDLGHYIQANISIDGRVKKIIVPALFIDFNQDYRYEFQDMGYIERNLTSPLAIVPMSQFSSYNNASSILQLTRDHDSKYDIGRLYGKSKSTKGMVKLTWKKGKLVIETCQQWKILMGFLFLNAEETIRN